MLSPTFWWVNSKMRHTVVIIYVITPHIFNKNQIVAKIRTTITLKPQIITEIIALFSVTIIRKNVATSFQKEILYSL